MVVILVNTIKTLLELPSNYIKTPFLQIDSVCVCVRAHVWEGGLKGAINNILLFPPKFRINCKIEDSERLNYNIIQSKSGLECSRVSIQYILIWTEVPHWRCWRKWKIADLSHRARICKLMSGQAEISSGGQAMPVRRRACLSIPRSSTSLWMQRSEWEVGKRNQKSISIRSALMQMWARAVWRAPWQLESGCYRLGCH